MTSRTRNKGRTGVGLLALLVLLESSAAQESRPASAPAGPYGRLQAELRLAPAGPEGARDRERILRKWFVLRQPDQHEALQNLLRASPDQETRSVVLDFLQADLAALLDGNGASTPEGLLFLGYLEPLIGLAGDGSGALAGKALGVLRELPIPPVRDRLVAHLKPPGGALLAAALVVAGHLQDTSLAPHVAAWLETPAHGRAARAALCRLTFQDFQSAGAFAAWWESVDNPSWAALRDRFVEESLTATESRRAGEEGAARQAREHTRARFLPLVRDLVELRLRRREWTQALALLRDEETRTPALLGLVGAFQADRKLLEGVGSEQEKACSQTFEFLLDLASNPGRPTNGDLLQALSFLAYLPPGREALATRALTTLLERTRTGPLDARPTVLSYLAAFTGWEADRALFELLCEPELPSEVLYRLLDILKGRTLSETGPIGEVGPVLERVVQRLPGLLTEGELPRRVRSDALLFAARLPTPLASPFLAKVLLGKEGLGERVEDRLAAADALQDLLVRQRKAPGLVETVGATLQEGLQLRDTQGLSLARVRAACAEKLGNDPFADPSQSLPIMESLGLALVIEKAPEALEAIVTAMRKLGQKVLKEPAPKALQKARFFLLQRLENQSGKAETPAEGDLLFPAVVELCGTDRASRIAAGRAFAAMGHREHALSLFESLALAPGGGGSGQAPMEPVDLAKLLRDHLSTLLTGRLPGESPPDPVLSGLGEAELLLGRKLLARLRELREAGVGVSWGRREQEWSLAVAWGLAQLSRESGGSGAEFFGEAADALQGILSTQSLPPLERLSRRVLRAQALIASAPARPKALAEAVAALQELVQEEPTHVQAQRLLAGAFEGQGAWAAAANQWRSLAGLFTRASSEEWSALLKALAAQIQAGQTSQAREFLEVLRSHPLPPEGEERAGIQRELARLAALLKSES